jgi:hypothetical protein
MRPFLILIIENHTCMALDDPVACLLILVMLLLIALSISKKKIVKISRASAVSAFLVLISILLIYRVFFGIIGLLVVFTVLISYSRLGKKTARRALIPTRQNSR